ncbi:MAG: pyridoxamine 5'-phosphate oxidase [Bacteroidota bacterium]
MLLDARDFREDYRRDQLLMEQTAADPFEQFAHWFEDAKQADITEPNAMTLATISAAGRPKARIVLLKQVLAEGFVFYTNYNSQKGQDLAANPVASLVFFWDALQRQVRIEGSVTKASSQTSTDYFHARPKGSQIGAAASPQSSVITGREVLEENVTTLENQYADANQLPRPDHWGGYVLTPDVFEFWQGRSSRLHDRIRYRHDGQDWIRERLAP